MQGKPLRELILVMVLVALLAPVIVRITRVPERATRTPIAEQKQEQMVATIVRIQFAHAPIFAAFGTDVELTARRHATQYEFERELDFSDRLIEWPFTVKWPEGTPHTAVTVTLEPEGLEARQLTFWGEGQLNEFIELHWHE